ncbi:MAG: hypothetical protein OSJ64_00645 [Firmicutes bacterium]|nr:hypothetical protein [Bacillota bacterium]
MKLYNAKAVARFLDLSERRVRQLRDEKVIEEYSPGLYDLMATNRRYINYLRQRNPESEQGIDYQTERAKLVRVKRQNAELDLQLKENKLHSSEDIEKVMGSMLTNFKARLMAVPAKLAPVLSRKSQKAEVFTILKSAIDEALNELADFGAAFDTGEDSENESSDE